MNNMIWNLFQQTGNIETYLLLKQLEEEKHEEESKTIVEEIASLQPKM